MSFDPTGRSDSSGVEPPEVRRTTPVPGGGVIAPYTPERIQLESWDDQRLVFSYRRETSDPVDDEFSRGCLWISGAILLAFGGWLGFHFRSWFFVPFAAVALLQFGLAIRDQLAVASRREEAAVQRRRNKGRFSMVFDRSSRAVRLVSPQGLDLFALDFDRVELNSWLLDTFIFSDAEPWDPDTCVVSVGARTDVADFLGRFVLAQSSLDDPLLGETIDRLKAFFGKELSANSCDPRDHLAGSGPH